MNPRFPKPPSCAGCSLERSGFGFAIPTGPVGARLTFVGEALGYEEAIHGEPFYGSAGGVLSRVLLRAGVDRRQVRIANVVSCFPGDTQIQAAAVSHVYRRWYEGSLVRVETTAGVLTGTPNHPVLTVWGGWLGLGELIEGDELIDCRVGQGVGVRDPDVHDPPSTLAEIFETAAEPYVCERVVGSHKDFHGDGSEAEIEVVRTNSTLGHWGVATRFEFRLHQVLEAARMNARFLLRSGPNQATPVDFLTRRPTTRGGFVRSVEQTRAVFSSAAFPAQVHRIAAGSYRDAVSLEQLVQAALTDPEPVREPLKAMSIAIQPARVLKVERCSFSGHVYNLATLSNQYVANGTIVHNCRPPNDYLAGAPWEEHAIVRCRQYLQPVLDAVPDNAVVVPLGATALTALLGLRGVPGVAVKDFHGTVTRDPSDRFWVVPTFHPSHLQRGAMNLLEVVTQDVRLAHRISQHGFTRSPAELVVDPHPDWVRRWVREHLQRLAADPEGTHLALDTEFAEKAGGADESEVVLADVSSPITRVNGGNDKTTGWTVPYRSPYREIVEELLAGVVAVRGWIWLWNKYADLDHLRRAGHTIQNGDCYVDAMWAWHFLQSDLPRGLGFVAPMASDFGAWKHWAKERDKEGVYAAADGVQTWRTAMWILSALHRQNMWDLFLTDWHERDVYVLRPAHEQGTPVNKTALEQFHQELQAKQADILVRIKQTAAQGVLKPKLGYAKKPKGVTCTGCDGSGRLGETSCTRCAGSGFECVPPASILGKPKKGGGEAKSQYMLEGVKLVEREIDVEINVCVTCGAEDVGPKHRCPLPKANKRKGRKSQSGVPDDGDGLRLGDVSATDETRASRGIAVLRTQRVRQRRFFWQLPFNPDAPAQVLAYLTSQGIDAPIDKKKQRATTNKKALGDLAKKHLDDPFFQLQLDWKAVQKVDSTYAVGALARLDQDDRLHPEFICKPSTFRDSCVGVNLQNVVADKAGPDGLASGFRRCVEARDGIPSNRTEDEIVAWRQRWG